MYAVVIQYRFQHASVLFQGAFVDGSAPLAAFRRGQKEQRRQLIILSIRQGQGRLLFFLGSAAFLHFCTGLLDPARCKRFAGQKLHSLRVRFRGGHGHVRFTAKQGMGNRLSSQAFGGRSG